MAGAHGKTSTTSLIAYALEQCGEDPTYLIGGDVPQLGSNARVGTGRYVVAEADESDGSLARLRPRAAVVLNAELDHHDHFASLGDLARAVPGVGRRAAARGAARTARVARLPAPNARSAATGPDRGRVGAHSTSSRTGMARASCSPHRVVIRCRCGSACPARTTRSTPRPRSPCSTGPGSLPSAPRRRWPSSAAPRAATSAGERSPGSASSTTTRTIRANWPPRSPPRAARPRPDALLACFQPHMPWRTGSSRDGFAEALRLRRCRLRVRVYVARGAADPAVTGELVVESALTRRIPRSRSPGRPGYADAADWIVRTARPGDLVLTLGAGPVDSVLGLVRERLRDDAPPGVEADAPLARLTTIGTGGPARFLARPASAAELAAVLAWADARGPRRRRDRPRLEPARRRCRV